MTNISNECKNGLNPLCCHDYGDGHVCRCSQQLSEGGLKSKTLQIIATLFTFSTF